MPMYSTGIPSYTLAQLMASAGSLNTLVIASDVGPSPGTLFSYSLALSKWRPAVPTVALFSSLVGFINIGGSGATYTQTGDTVTVTWTAHGLTADRNGSFVYLTQSTGTFVTEMCTNFTYVNANTFTCTSATSRTTSGNLGTNTAETFGPTTYQVPSGLILAKDSLALAMKHQAKSSANNKTLKYYYTDLAISASGTSITTAGTMNYVGAGGQYFVTDTTFETTGLNTTPATDTNRTYKVSSTLANASDWHFVCLNIVSITPRAGL